MREKPYFETLIDSHPYRFATSTLLTFINTFFNLYFFSRILAHSKVNRSMLLYLDFWTNSFKNLTIEE